MLTTILIILATATVVALLLATRLPDEFRLTRTTAIDAPIGVVWPYLSTLNGWIQWSPFAKADPSAQTSINGDDGSIGSSLSWQGKRTGQGTMTLVDAQPPRFAKYRLDFKKPMQASNHAEFRAETQGTQTVVCWTMHGHNSYVNKLISLFMNCEKMLGATFESGLADLKELAARAAKEKA